MLSSGQAANLSATDLETQLLRRLLAAGKRPWRLVASPQVVAAKIFLHETSPAKGGIPFTVSGETLTVYASVTDMISDGDGQRQGSRGAQTDLAERPLCSGLRGSTLRRSERLGGLA